MRNVGDIVLAFCDNSMREYVIMQKYKNLNGMYLYLVERSFIDMFEEKVVIRYYITENDIYNYC
jgi:hypothetical protein